MFVRPTIENLRQEYHVECVLKGMNLCSLEDFLERAMNAPLVTWTAQKDKQTEYRSHTKTKERLLKLIRGYRSYPEFRNEKTIENLYDRIGSGKEMTAPIVIKRNDKMRVLAGNTRLDVAFQLGVTPSVLLIDFDT